MLQSFVRMCNFTLQRHLACKKYFWLSYFPDAEFGLFVNIMLIKEGQLYVYGFSLQVVKNNFIQAGFYNLFTEYLLQWLSIDLPYK